MYKKLRNFETIVVLNERLKLLRRNNETTLNEAKLNENLLYI